MVGDYMGTLGDVRFCPSPFFFALHRQDRTEGEVGQGLLDKGYSSERGISHVAFFFKSYTLLQSIHYYIFRHYFHLTFIL